MDPYVGVCSISMSRIGQGVGDVGGEVFPTQGNFRDF